MSVIKKEVKFPITNEEIEVKIHTMDNKVLHGGIKGIMSKTYSFYRGTFLRSIKTNRTLWISPNNIRTIEII